MNNGSEKCIESLRCGNAAELVSIAISVKQCKMNSNDDRRGLLKGK